MYKCMLLFYSRVYSCLQMPQVKVMRDKSGCWFFQLSRDDTPICTVVTVMTGVTNMVMKLLKIFGFGHRVTKAFP